MKKLLPLSMALVSASMLAGCSSAEFNKGLPTSQAPEFSPELRKALKKLDRQTQGTYAFKVKAKAQGTGTIAEKVDYDFEAVVASAKGKNSFATTIKGEKAVVVQTSAFSYLTAGGKQYRIANRPPLQITNTQNNIPDLRFLSKVATAQAFNGPTIEDQATWKYKVEISPTKLADQLQQVGGTKGLSPTQGLALARSVKNMAEVTVYIGKDSHDLLRVKSHFEVSKQDLRNVLNAIVPSSAETLVQSFDGLEADIEINQLDVGTKPKISLPKGPFEESGSVEQLQKALPDLNIFEAGAEQVQ